MHVTVVGDVPGAGAARLVYDYAPDDARFVVGLAIVMNGRFRYLIAKREPPEVAIGEKVRLYLSMDTTSRKWRRAQAKRVARAARKAGPPC